MEVPIIRARYLRTEERLLGFRSICQCLVTNSHQPRKLLKGLVMFCFYVWLAFMTLLIKHHYK